MAKVNSILLCLNATAVALLVCKFFDIIKSSFDNLNFQGKHFAGVFESFDKKALFLLLKYLQRKMYIFMSIMSTSHNYLKRKGVGTVLFPSIHINST